MKLIIIACCKTKRSGGNNNYQSSPLAGNLSDTHFQQLMTARRELISNLNLPPGPDLGSGVHHQSIEFMPAYQRYIGIIYQGCNFESIYPQTNKIKVIIISALYGILDASERIRNYELNMDCTIPNGRKVKTWWKNHGLGSILKEIVCNNHFEIIHELLPISYRESLKPWPPECGDEKIIQYDYPGQGSGSIWRRAEDLQKILNN